MHNKNQLLIIGGVSSDILHLQDSTAKCAGGAGMYTAVAATHCGAHSILFGPRPNICPEHLTIVDQYLSDCGLDGICYYNERPFDKNGDGVLL